MSSQSPLPTPETDYAAPAGMRVNPATWNAVFGSIGARIRTMEAMKTTIDALIEELQIFGLQRLDEAILPLIEEQQGKLTQFAADLDAEIARLSTVVSDFEAQTATALTELGESINTALSNANATIATTLSELETTVDETITSINASLADVQAAIDTILADGIPAANVAEDAERVFVTPAQKAEIGQLREDLGTLGEAFDDLTDEVEAKQATSAKGAANGYAGLDSDGKVPTAHIPVNAQFNEYSASGTYTVPVWAKTIYVEGIGGGASGQNNRSTGSSGGTALSGRGGTFNYAIFARNQLPETVSFTVGAGGAGTTITGSTGVTNQGNAGGDTTFHTMTAPGGGQAHVSDPYGGSLKALKGGGGLEGGAHGTTVDSVNNANAIATNGSYPGGGGGGAGIRQISSTVTSTSGSGAGGRLRVWAW